MRRSGKRPTLPLVFSFVGAIVLENAVFVVFEDDMRPVMGLDVILAIHETTSIDLIVDLLLRVYRVNVSGVDFWYPQTGDRWSVLTNGKADWKNITEEGDKLIL